jgi:hypothetical protein
MKRTSIIVLSFILFIATGCGGKGSSGKEWETNVQIMSAYEEVEAANGFSQAYLAVSLDRPHQLVFLTFEKDGYDPEFKVGEFMRVKLVKCLFQCDTTKKSLNAIITDQADKVYRQAYAPYMLVREPEKIFYDHINAWLVLSAKTVSVEKN